MKDSFFLFKCCNLVLFSDFELGPYGPNMHSGYRTRPHFVEKFAFPRIPMMKTH